MSESFFRLDADERKEVIQRGAIESGMPDDVLEKDIWLVWTLDKLFAMPDASVNRPGCVKRADPCMWLQVSA